MRPHTTTPPNAVVTWSRTTTVADIIGISILFLIVGLWYAGPVFLQHFFDGIPVSAVGSAVGHMTSGDQYEAYYRHTLPFYNFERNKPLLYSGYQYALSSNYTFVDGMIYLPFALLVSLLAFAIGPIAAYNSMAILSFSLCGISGYLLGREVTRSRLAGLVAASIVAFLPFRVGFLFGEMFYATDTALLPLALFFFLRLLQTNSWKYAASFASVILLLATANFALLYWTALLFGPFFLAGFVYIAHRAQYDWRKLCAIVAATALPLLVTSLYVFHVKGVLGSSGLASGQDLEEVRFYSPGFNDLLIRWDGIEKTIYTGLTGLLAAFGIVCVVQMRKHRANTTLYGTALYVAALFIISYMLALGLSFDSATGIPLYKAMFKYVPFANASRTPGRLMPIVGVCAAVLVSIFATRVLGRFRSTRVRALLTLALVLLIVVDFKFSSVTMTTLETDNRSYAAISGTKDLALGIPFRSEADHYAATTYQYFALTNNIRMVNGHSSTFPSSWTEFYAQAHPLNYGEATRSVLEGLRGRGVRYLLVHSTTYEPNVSIYVVAVLDANPALHRLKEDSGVVLYEIVNPELAPVFFDAQTYVDAIRRDSSLTLTPSVTGPHSGVEELAGWYSLESYPNQRPFRWMSGTSSLLLVTPNALNHSNTLVFSYKCPSGDLKASGLDINVTAQSAGQDGWQKMTVTIPNNVTSVVTLNAPSIYTVLNDQRKFGCMIGDFSVQ